MDQKTQTTPVFSEKKSSKQLLINSLTTGDKPAFLAHITQIRDFMFRDEQGDTLLHLAAKAPKNALFFTNTLLELEKIPINARNEAKETPLYIAVKRRDIALIRLYMAHHANPHAQNGKGETPISLAISEKQSNILAVLTRINVVDINLERLKLRENILSLTDEINLLTETLNQLPRWLQQLPLQYHTRLLNLQKSLPDRYLTFDSSKEVKNKKPRDDSSSSKGKEKNLKTKFTASLKAMHTSPEKEKKNKRVGEILELLTSLISNLKEEKNDQYKNIVDHLEKLVAYYTSPLETNEDKKIVKQLRIQIPGLGYRDLSAAAAKKFIRYFMDMDSEERKKEMTHKTNEHGLHDVIQMNEVHYKVNPTAPGIEYSVHILGELLTGQVSTPTELLVIEQLSVNEQNETQVKFLPVLASQTVSGILLHDLLEQDPTATQKFDSHSFGLQCILAFLSGPRDGKPSNFIAKPQFNEEGQRINYALVSIDSDEAYSDPILESNANKQHSFGNQHSLGIRTCILCLPQVDEPIDMVLRRQILELNPVVLTLRWLQFLTQYNASFEGKDIATYYLKDVFSTVGLPQRLVPKTVIQFYQTFSQIQILLREQAELTPAKLLEKLENPFSLVKLYYDYARQESQGDILKAANLLYRGPFFEELNLSSDQKEILNKCTQKGFDYQKKREQSIGHALEEFCEFLDFSKFDIETQKAILKELTINFSDITHLTLRQCDALNDTAMEEMSKRFKRLTHITLQHCRIFTAKGIHALLQRFPTLQITLEGFESLKPHDLLTISRFCSRLYLILPGSSKPLVVKNNNPFLLPAALKQNNINLITFLLLAGFHLTEEAQIYSPLHDAITQKNPSLVCKLLEYRSDQNQYLGKSSPLDHAYELLQKTPASDTHSINHLRWIIVFLLTSGAVETSHPKPILEIGKKNWQEQASKGNKGNLAKALINFALAHNQLNATLVNELVDVNDDIINWSRQWPFGYQISDATFQALFTLIKSSTKPIKILNLSGCMGITKQHIQICSQLNLKTLMLDFQQASETGLIKENDLITLFKTKGIQVQINAIQLNGKKAVQEHFSQLIQVLSQPENKVKRLEITHSVLSTNQIQQFSNALKKQLELKRVILRGIGLGQTGDTRTSHFSMLMIGLESPTLIELCLDENNLKADNMIILASWLKNHAELTELSLYGNPLGDEGILNLAPGLAYCQKLKKLNINQINLTDHGFKEWLFGQVPTATLTLAKNRIPPAINFLDVGFNQLTAASIPEILETIRLNQSLSQFVYAGQAELEKELASKKLTDLLQRNALLSLQQTLLEPYQQHFFQTNAPKQKALAVSTTRVSLNNLSESNTISALQQLLIIFQEETDKIEQTIGNLLSYQEEKKELIDRDIEYNEFDQAALESDVLYLGKINDKTSQEQIIQLRDQIQILAIQQDTLRLQYDRKIAYQAAFSTFNQNPELCLFYCKMRLKLETLFTQCKLTANAPVAQVFSNRDPDCIELLQNKSLTFEQIKYIDQLGTLKMLLKAAEKTARDITKTFQKSIQGIVEQSKKFNIKTKEQIEDMARNAMARILKALKLQTIQGNTISFLANQLILAGCGLEIEMAVVTTESTASATSASTTPFWANGQTNQVSTANSTSSASSSSSSFLNNPQ